MNSKYLASFTIEGAQIRTQIRTKNNWKTFYIWNGQVFLRGFRGTYKGKTVRYKNYCPEGKVRHHVYYNDEDINEGVVFLSPKEHADKHRNKLNGQFGGRVKKI